MFLHRSRFIEELAQGLAQLLGTPAPGADVFEPDLVAIQGRGSERWLSMQLADALGVSANAEFPFPRQCISSMLDSVLGPQREEAALFETQQASFAIARLLRELNPTELGEVRGYLDAVGDAGRLSFARRVAGIFDQYAVYRPELLLRWDAAPEFDWQSVLWHRLSHMGQGAHLARRAHDFVQQVRRGLSDKARARLPRRVSFFGLTSLPPLYVQLLSALGSEIEVHLFLLSPSDEYWADIRDTRELLRERLKGSRADFQDASCGHPLLSELGHRSRDMQSVLEQHDDYHELPVPHAPERSAQNLLQLLQDDMAALRDRGLEPDGERPSIGVEDRSIEIHSCFMPSRELEVLREQLLDAFARDPSLKPHEVVVMAPNIESYAPLIEAVFGVRDEHDRVAIPYRVADRGGREALPVVDAFFALTSFLSSRMHAPELLDLLRRAPIADACGIGDADLPLASSWLASSGLRFGADALHRAQEGLPESPLNTLRFGLDRLLLGLAVDGRDAPLPFADHLPEAVDTGELDLLGRLVGWLEGLLVARRELEHAANCAQWSERLLALSTRFCAGAGPAADADQEAQLDKLRAGIASVAQSAALAGFDEEIPVSLFLAELLGRVSAASVSGGLFGGGVTFCQLVPMRALPFRVVALIGMGDEHFPRRTPRADFDRMASSPRLADPSPRDDDRQLFLEALLSARERLIITYEGQSAQDGKSRPPSVLVSALLDHLGGAYRFEGVDAAHDAPSAARERLMVTHPLSRMSPRYFLGEDPRLFSHSEADRRAAAASLGTPARSTPFLEGMDEEVEEPPRDLSLSALVASLTAPSSAFLRLRLGLMSLRDDALPQGEDPLELDGLERHGVGQELLELVGRGLSDEELVSRAWARGLLPHGNPGHAQLADLLGRARAIHRIAHGANAVAPQHPLSLDLDLGDTHLYGVSMQPSFGDRVEARFGSLGAKHQLRAWLHHLASCAAQGASQTRMVGADKTGPQAFVLKPVTDTRSALGPLVEMALSLHQQPLPLIPEASLAYVLDRRSPKRRDRALERARQTVRDSFIDDGRRRVAVDDKRVFSDSLDALFGSDEGDFARVAEQVFAPLVDHREPLSEPS